MGMEKLERIPAGGDGGEGDGDGAEDKIIIFGEIKPRSLISI